MTKKRFKWSVIGLVVIATILFTVWTSENRSVDTQSTNTLAAAPKVGYRLPSFTLQKLDSNETISTAQLAGKPIFINFWTSWCTYCKLEAPDIERAYQKYGNKIIFLSINVTSQDSMSGIRDFVKQYGMTWQVPLDDKGSVAKKYQVIAFPTSFFVNKNGLIEDKVVGSLSPGTLNTDLEAILK